MALNRDKFRKIVGGITTAETEPPRDDAPSEPAMPSGNEPHVAVQGHQPADRALPADEAKSSDHRRFAKRGRPKAGKESQSAGKGPKVKVSLFLSEVLVNDLYDWAHNDRIHPGEMFERALKPFHEKESKRRNAGKE